MIIAKRKPSFANYAPWPFWGTPTPIKGASAGNPQHLLPFGAAFNFTLNGSFTGGSPPSGPPMSIGNASSSTSMSAAENAILNLSAARIASAPAFDEQREFNQ